MNNKKIYIDGQETRRRIGEMAGKAHGVRKICMERGLAKETVNQIIRKGYGTAETIDRCIKAGIPIKISDRPIPCRAKREHSRTKRPELTLQDCGIKTEEQHWINLPFKPATDPQRQITLDEIQNSEMKELLIRHLTALIEDLKKI